MPRWTREPGGAHAPPGTIYPSSRWMLPEKVAEVLSRAAPRRVLGCPVCGRTATAERNGDWRCEAKTSATALFGRRNTLTCNARGVTLPDGSLGVLSRPYRRNDD